VAIPEGGRKEKKEGTETERRKRRRKEEVAFLVLSHVFWFWVVPCGTWTAALLLYVTHS